MLTHRLNEPLQPRQHLRLGVEKPLRAVARENSCSAFVLLAVSS